MKEQKSLIATKKFSQDCRLLRVTYAWDFRAPTISSPSSGFSPDGLVTTVV
jgi:hypothetical protein